MSDVSLFVIILIGKVLIFTGQKFPLFQNLNNKFLRGLFECDFCLGVWTYFILSSLFRSVLFSSVYYFPIVSELATAAILSLIVHLVSIGWSEKFSKIVVS